MLRSGLIAALVAVMVFAPGCKKKVEKAVTQNSQYFGTVPEVNLAHVKHLTREIELGGKKALVVWIYAEVPDYKPITDPDEGFTCVDDTARFAVMMLLNAKRTGDAESESMARKALSFVLAMQDEDGQFYNFLLPDMSINKTHETSVKDHGWWASRALWALGTGYRYFLDRDPAFAAELKAAADRLLPWYNSYLAKHGKFEVSEDVEVPQWLIKGNSCMTAEAILGMLEFQQAAADDKMAERIAKLADGLAMFQRQSDAGLLAGAHPSNVDRPHLWHHWGSRQTMALARAARVLPGAANRALWLASAEYEANIFFKRMLNVGVPEVVEPGWETQYPQIAYGTNSLVLGFAELSVTTGRRSYREMADSAFAWYAGANPANEPMYDPETGRCFDGIVGSYEINRNSGAESTIEALLALEILHGPGSR